MTSNIPALTPQGLSVGLTKPSVKPLAASASSDVLFAFRLQPFLGQSKVIPLPIDFQVLGIPKNYVEIDTIPGQITITPVCVDGLRLVKAFGVDYALHQNKPNPVSGTTLISYGIGLEARTTIELFNSSGEKVAVLLDQMQKPGENEFEFAQTVFQCLPEPGVLVEAKSHIPVFIFAACFFLCIPVGIQHNKKRLSPLPGIIILSQTDKRFLCR